MSTDPPSADRATDLANGRGLGRRRLVVAGAVVAVLGVVVAVWALQGRDGGTVQAAPPAATEDVAPEVLGPPVTVPTEDPAAPGEDPATTSPDEPAPDPSDPALGSGTVDVVELPAVDIAEEAEFGGDVSARIAEVARVDGEGRGVGERSGPALELTVEIINDSAEVVDLDYVVVNLYGPDGAPGPALMGDPRSAPFSGTVDPGKSATAVYVHRLPDPDAATARVTVSYGAGAPTVVFAGEVPA